MNAKKRDRARKWVEIARLNIRNENKKCTKTIAAIQRKCNFMQLIAAPKIGHGVKFRVEFNFSIIFSSPFNLAQSRSRTIAVAFYSLK